MEAVLSEIKFEHVHPFYLSIAGRSKSGSIRPLPTTYQNAKCDSAGPPEAVGKVDRWHYCTPRPLTSSLAEFQCRDDLAASA